MKPATLMILFCLVPLVLLQSSEAQTIYGLSEDASAEFSQAFVALTGCGGIVVDDDHVLTAAHCPFVGSVTLVALAQSIKVLGNGPCCHPCFAFVEGHIRLQNDLALLKLNSPVDIQNQWNLDDVLLEPEEEQGKEFVTVAMIQGGQIRRTRNMRVLNEAVCMAQHGDSVGDEEFCVGSTQSNVCEGASGGPLFKVDADPPTRPTHLAGIVSDAEVGDCSKIYDLYTKIDRGWIRGVLSGEDWCGKCKPFDPDFCQAYRSERAGFPD